MIEGLLKLDRSAFLFLNSLHIPWLDHVMIFLSGQLIWIPLTGYFIWLSFKTYGGKSCLLFLLFLVLALAASDVTSSYILKNIFERLRPCKNMELMPLIHFFGQKCGGKYGFVSSHAANSLCLVVFSILALRPKSKFFHLIWSAPLIVSFSRVYLGAHYPGDVLGGFVVGAFWGTVLGKVYYAAHGARR